MSIIKRFIPAALAVLLALSMAGCAASNYRLADDSAATSALSPGATHTDAEGVGIEIQNVIRDGEEVSLEILWHNDTAHDVTFGAAFTVERQVGGQWQDCSKADTYFIEIACVLPAKGEYLKEYTLSEIYDISQPGKYRFRTSCHVPTGEDGTQNCQVWAEFTVEEPVDVPFRAQYIRTDGGWDGAGFPAVHIIRSVEELTAYYEANKETFYLGRNENPASDSTIGFLDACDKYDEAFFESKYLLFVLLEEGSGSIRHKVTRVQQLPGNQLSVNIDTITPEIGTEDMAQWHIILELDKAPEEVRESDVQVYLNGRLADTSPNPVDFPDSVSAAIPTLTVLSGSGTGAVFPSSHYWEYEGQAVCTEALHPLEMKYPEPMELSGPTAKLVFSEDPKSFTVRCWPDSAWGDTDAESQPLEPNGFEIPLQPGGYIYEVSAKWSDASGNYGGTYSFRAIT